MTDFVDQFRLLVRLLVKWTLISIAAIVSLTGATAAGIYGWGWWTHDRHKANVIVRAFADAKRCEDAKFPIAIEVVNRSARTIEQTSIYLKARRPGRSTDLALGSYDSDQIIEPNQGFGQCWSTNLSEAARNEDPRGLEWSVDFFSVRFAD